MDCTPPLPPILERFQAKSRALSTNLLPTPIVGRRVGNIPLFFIFITLLFEFASAERFSPSNFARLGHIPQMREARVGDGPLSLKELARFVERHYKNVNSGVTRLIERG
jgi:hypothetical protein